MTPLPFLEGALLVVGVAAMTICVLGVAVMPGVFARLHYQSAAGTVAAAAIVLAVILHAGLSSVSVKAGLILLFTWTSGPVLTHALAHAARTSLEGPEGSA
jgi:multicomponent Na+:H+ antiporter subunit G